MVVAVTLAIIRADTFACRSSVSTIGNTGPTACRILAAVSPSASRTCSATMAP